MFLDHHQVMLAPSFIVDSIADEEQSPIGKKVCHSRVKLRNEACVPHLMDGLQRDDHVEVVWQPREERLISEVAFNEHNSITVPPKPLSRQPVHMRREVEEVVSLDRTVSEYIIGQEARARSKLKQAQILTARRYLANEIAEYLISMRSF